MSTQLSAEDLLANYLDGFLWPDEDWLEVDGAYATYWQARLPQTTTVQILPDGRTKWRIATRIVAAVPDGADAHRLCLELNRYAAGWSFAYDSAEGTIDAIAAICALPEWDTFFLRLSEKAKLSAWMSDVIAERLAEAVGGTPAFSHPNAQSGLRESFDGTYYYLQTLRGRPEWVIDLTRSQFPSVEQTAAAIAEVVGAGPEAIFSDESEVRIMLGPSMGLSAGFDTHPIVGDGWTSALIVPPRRNTSALAKHLSALTWALFEDSETNLLGGFTLSPDGLAFRQWNTTSEVRNQEQLGSYTEHSVTTLWGFTSTLSDVVGLLAQSELPPDDDTDPGSGPTDWAAYVVAAIGDQARAAVSECPADGDVPADRRLLWLERRQITAIAAWFNPMGPTVSTTEVCALPDGTEYLVHFRRHPFAPYYRVVGPLTEDVDLAQIHSEAADLLIRGSLPNVLTLWDADPEAGAADVPEVLRNRILEVAAEGGEDLAVEAAWIEKTMGDPWEFAPFDQTEADKFRAAAGKAAAARPSPDGGFAAWWKALSSFDNVLSNFRFLPDAWDGALNTQRDFGNLGHFDVDPLLVTYSTIGMTGD